LGIARRDRGDGGGPRDNGADPGPLSAILRQPRADPHDRSRPLAGPPPPESPRRERCYFARPALGFAILIASRAAGSAIAVAGTSPPFTFWKKTTSAIASAGLSDPG